MERLAELQPLQDEVADSRARLGRNADDKWKWRLTLNHYPRAGAAGGAASTGATNEESDAVRLGFPWHRDLSANGAATMILNLGAEGSLEFGKEPPSTSPVDGLRYSSDHSVVEDSEVEPLEQITLTDGDVLLLTGPSRWEYLHRVVPEAGGAERASLVYGVW